MKIAQIHTGTLGSIGKIVADISMTLTRNGIENYAVLADCNGEKPDNYVIFSNRRRNKVNRILGRITGFNNCFAYRATRNLISELEKIQPDVIHLHNLHDGYVNIKILFDYLSKSGKVVIWTFHDCWPFTGRCPYFELAGCNKWKTNCYSCPTYRQYPKAMFDRSSYLYNLKKSSFLSLQKLTVVTPSKWLASKVGESFFKSVPVSVIYNGINTEVFHVTESNIRAKYGLENRQIVLGVASPFDYRKGVHIFERLSKDLPPDKFAIVMIGLSEEQVSSIPDGILKLTRTSDQSELAAWYTVADVFVNPTLEEVLGMTNIEALACGTPVVTFRSGGSPETISSNTGIVVERNNYSGLLQILLEEKYRDIKPEDCIMRANAFTKEKMTQEYVKLYEQSIR